MRVTCGADLTIPENFELAGGFCKDIGFLLTLASDVLDSGHVQK